MNYLLHSFWVTFSSSVHCKIIKFHQNFLHELWVCSLCWNESDIAMVLLIFNRPNFERLPVEMNIIIVRRQDLCCFTLTWDCFSIFGSLNVLDYVWGSYTTYTRQRKKLIKLNDWIPTCLLRERLSQSWQEKYEPIFTPSSFFLISTYLKGSLTIPCSFILFSTFFLYV